MLSLNFPVVYLRSLTYLILFFLTAIPAKSQVLTDGQKDREQIFTARVKQFSEFADRFNLKTDFNGNPADSAFLKKMPRTIMLSMLFDLKDPRTDKNAEEYSPDYVRMKELFISEVAGNNLILDKYSSLIIAEAGSKVIFRGETHKIKLFLIQETSGRDMIKWVLCAATGNIFDIYRADTSMVRFIAPASNETDFINLKRALSDTEHLGDYAYSGYKPDGLTLFFSLIRSGELKFEYVEEVVYHVIDIPGWYFRIKDFNRNELNSGWLITDVSRNNLDTADFIRDLH